MSPAVAAQKVAIDDAPCRCRLPRPQMGVGLAEVVTLAEVVSLVEVVVLVELVEVVEVVGVVEGAAGMLDIGDLFGFVRFLIELLRTLLPRRPVQSSRTTIHSTS